MLLWLLLAGLGFGFVVHLCDRPSVPAWQGKYAYRALAFCLWMLLIGVVWKASLWHQELVFQIRLCR